MQKKLTRQQRKHLNGLIIDLEDLSQDSEESMIEEINRIRGLLSSYGADPHSNYYQRLEALVSKSERPDFRLGKRKYRGFIRGYSAMVMPVYDHIFLSRSYPAGRFRMSWRFGKTGKIQLVDLATSDKQEFKHILTLSTLREGDIEEWKTATFYHPVNMPRETACLNTGFSELDVINQYQSIIRFGHGIAREILQLIKEGTIPADSPPLKEGDAEQTGILTEMPKDSTAVYMIERITRFRNPKVNDFRNQSLKVSYEAAD